MHEKSNTHTHTHTLAQLLILFKMPLGFDMQNESNS